MKVSRDQLEPRPGIGVSSLEHVKKLLTMARHGVAERATGEKSEEYQRYFKLFEPLAA